MSIHLDSEQLVAYWLAEAAPAVCDELEEHLFSCPACALRLDAMQELMGALATRARGGVVPFISTAALLNRLARDGVRIREFTLRSGETVPCAVTHDDQLLIVRLLGDFSGSGRLDLTFDVVGMPQVRVTDVPVNRQHGEICVREVGDVVRTFPSMTMTFRVLDVGPEGERLLGEFRLEHHA